MKTILATVIVGVAVGFAPAVHADDFVLCPDGHEGVVGDHTSCPFAENVRKGFFVQNQPEHFTAYSPVTGEGYEMGCNGPDLVRFIDGAVVTGFRCYGGNGAEVVVW
jgi:hypothetical protein